MNKKVILDAATIFPGKGGAGGGIWNYTKNLILYLDTDLDFNRGMKCICLVNKQFDLPLRNIVVKQVPFEPDNFIFRLLYIHLYLPLYVLLQRGVLHKVYFEVPFWMPFKTVVTIHDLMERFYKTRNYSSISVGKKVKSSYINWVTNKAIRNSKWICTPTQSVKHELIEHYKVSPEKVVVTPLAAPGFKILSSKFEENKTVIDLYCIAAFHPHKGHLRLIQIFEKLCENYAGDVRLNLRGHVIDKAFFQCVEEKIRLSKFRDKIFIVNYQASSSVEEIYAKADWVILLSEYEGFGLPIIEAQANGVPVICSSIPTFKEAAGDSVFYLDDHLSTSIAADLLEQVISNSQQRKYFIEKGLKNAKQYSWEKLSDQMITLYKSLD